MLLVRPITPSAIAPPTADPPRPNSVVSQIGIGSGPGTAQRASAPMMKPEKRKARIVPSTLPNYYPACSASNFVGVDRGLMREPDDAGDAVSIAKAIGRRRPASRIGRLHER